MVLERVGALGFETKSSKKPVAVCRWKRGDPGFRSSGNDVSGQFAGVSAIALVTIRSGSEQDLALRSRAITLSGGDAAGAIMANSTCQSSLYDREI